MSALIRVILSEEVAQVRPGDRKDLTLTVQNFSEVVDRYRILIEGVDPSWVTASREEVALFPKDQDQVRLTFHPPEGPESRADRYALQIVVISQENPGEQTAVPLTLEVQALSALEVQLRPQRGRGVGAGAFALEVRNTGNADLTVQLEASDPEEGLLYAFEPARLILPAGQEQTVRLHVRPQAPLPGDQPRAYPFTVTARPVEAPRLARQVQGEWVQLAPTLELSLQPQRGRGSGEGTFGLRIHNAGDADLTVHLEASDPEGGLLLALEPPQIVVPAGQEQQVRLRLRPRAALPGDQPRAFTFHVVARPVEAAQVTRQVEGQWEQTPPALEVALHPPRGSGAEGYFAIVVRNPGDTAMTVQLEASDALEGCLYALSPAQIALPAGQERSVQLRLRARAELAAGETRSYPFTVNARSLEPPHLTRSVEGEWTYKASVQARPQPASRTAVWGPLLLVVIGWIVAWVVQVLLTRAILENFGGWLFEAVARAGGVEAAEVLVERVLQRLLHGAFLGLIGGLGVGLGLRWASPAIRGKQLWPVVWGWAACWMVARLFLALAGDDFIQGPLAWGIYGAMVGAAGGWLTGRALRRAEPAVKAWPVVLGWAGGWGLGEMIASWPGFAEPLLPLVDRLIPILDHAAFLLVLGLPMVLIAGAIGGAAMFLYLSRVRAVG